MTKKKETKKEIITEEVIQVVEQPKVETPVMDIPEPKVRERKVPPNEWEVKDRLYILSFISQPSSSVGFFFSTLLGFATTVSSKVSSKNSVTTSSIFST